jgi:hypothetical protein
MGTREGTKVDESILAVGTDLKEAVLAHAGGLDEMGILLFPIVVGFGFWILTRQPNRPDKKP